mmetsp:Transcript_17733/g.32684  ORF Transcript_17733/g.32684 Transcript_17733/m.32684 type:complete len:88 (+) Transcript_17733:71-334(+)
MAGALERCKAEEQLDTALYLVSPRCVSAWIIRSARSLRNAKFSIEPATAALNNDVLGEEKEPRESKVSISERKNNLSHIDQRMSLSA